MRGLSIGALVVGSLWFATQLLACVPPVALSPKTVKIAIVYPFAAVSRSSLEESVLVARRLVGERAALVGCRVELTIVDSWEWEPGRRARSVAMDPATMIVLGHGPGSDLTIAGDVYRVAGLPWISFASADQMPSATGSAWFAVLPSDQSADQSSKSHKTMLIGPAMIEAAVAISLDSIEEACSDGQPTRDGISSRLAERAGQLHGTFQAIAS